MEIKTYRTLTQNPALYKENGTLELVCARCGVRFRRARSKVRAALRNLCPDKPYCSWECYRSVVAWQDVCCLQCGKTFSKRNDQVRRSEHHFCSRSCSATWRNLHKTTGTRRSKLEVWLEERLRERYPNLEILFNAKEAIGAELDIHLPSLNLAFGLNGIYHYEPIHGEGKLASIQSNDHRKFAACAERSISLCVIDVSTMKKFKEKRAFAFLDIVCTIIDQNCAGREDRTPVS